MPAPPVFEIDHWRIHKDTAPSSGSPIASTDWVTAEDASSGWEVEPGSNHFFGLRHTISETAGNDAGNEEGNLQFSVNGGAWTDITTGPTAALAVRKSSGTLGTRGTLGTGSLSLTSGQGTAASGLWHYEPVQFHLSGSQDVPDGNEYCEFDWGLEVSSTVTGGSTVELRLWHGAATTDVAMAGAVPYPKIVVVTPAFSTGTGASTGDSTADGIGALFFSAPGSAIADSTVLGTGAPLFSALGSAVSDSTAEGVGDGFSQ